MKEVSVVLVNGDTASYHTDYDVVVIDGFVTIPICPEKDELVAFNVNHVLSFNTRKLK